jgi:hypothetical protein
VQAFEQDSERLITHGATLRVLARLRARVFASATRMAPRQLRRFHSGDLLDRVRLRKSIYPFHIRQLITAMEDLTIWRLAAKDLSHGRIKI